eukprot:4971414-Heterocapsa_arctica.AAC.1
MQCSTHAVQHTCNAVQRLQQSPVQLIQQPPVQHLQDRIAISQFPQSMEQIGVHGADGAHVADGEGTPITDPQSILRRWS